MFYVALTICIHVTEGLLVLGYKLFHFLFVGVFEYLWQNFLEISVDYLLALVSAKLGE